MSSVNRAAAAAFVIAFATLFTQVLVHRVVSAKLLNNYAFLVISLTLLGFAFSGVVLTRWLPAFVRRLDTVVLLCMMGFGVSLIAITAAFYQLPVAQTIHTREAYIDELLGWIPASLAYAVPFAFSGLALGALLSAPNLSSYRIYGFDLLGSGLGALLVVPAISTLGVEVSLLAVSAAAMLGVLATAATASASLRIASGALAVALLAGTMVTDRLFVMRYPAGSMLATLTAVDPQATEHVAWDALARIEVSRISPPNPNAMAFPSLIGSNRDFHQRFERILTQNNFAFTYAVNFDGKEESLKGIEETIYAAAYHASSVPQPSAYVIGVGGGFDILTALAFDVSSVEAVEVNGATVDVLNDVFADYFSAWRNDPRVSLVHADGRQHLARSERRFDVLQLSGVDSYSGTPGAAHVFSESYLYTREAFDLYMSRLTENGIMNLMRLEFLLPREMLRAVVTAVGALRRIGAKDPAKHIMTVTQIDGRFTSMLVKRTPFTAEEVARVKAWTEGSPWLVLTAAPDMKVEPTNHYQQFLALNDVTEEGLFLVQYPMNVIPVDDDRPFFFRFSYWYHVFTNDPFVRLHSIPHMELAVLMLFAAMLLAVLVCVLVPLVSIARRGLHSPSAGRWTAYFAGVGLAFMAVEVALLQKFGFFLGHPNLALPVVLAVLLSASGVGALLAARLPTSPGVLKTVAIALGAIVLLELWLVMPALTGWLTWGLTAKIALVAVMVTPLGICMGVFFPHALSSVKRTDPAYAPWAWGVNGVFSVLGPVFAVAVSISVGTSSLLALAVPIYLLSVLAHPRTEEVPA